MRQAAVLLVLLGTGMMFGNAGAIGSEPAKEDAPSEAKPVAATAATASDDSKFKLPTGFVKKKRGKYILYCKREAPMGTRIRSETCYDERQMRDYLVALQENKTNVDRIRATCANVCACGMPEAC